MKKTTYISLFVLLGVIVSSLIHGGVEMLAIHFLTSDFERYGLGLTWSQWYTVHHVGTIALLVAGVALGLWQGRYWWKVMYGGEKRERA